jgi:hypothetical protein
MSAKMIVSDLKKRDTLVSSWSGTDSVESKKKMIFFLDFFSNWRRATLNVSPISVVEATSDNQIDDAHH